jgi:hypothetical protein
MRRFRVVLAAGWLLTSPLGGSLDALEDREVLDEEGGKRGRATPAPDDEAPASEDKDDEGKIRRLFRSIGNEDQARDRDRKPEERRKAREREKEAPRAEPRRDRAPEPAKPRDRVKEKGRRSDEGARRTRRY